MGPFFSIGVTTYNRRELLKQALSSIIGQTFSDFEVIVGNDYIQETLSAKVLGIEDPRIRFVNYAQNLGEIKNMNSLLEMSHGRYFTWLADDDMYAPNFLQAVHATLVKFDFPPCVFTSYMSGPTFLDGVENFAGEGQLFEGRQFLQLYLARTLKTQGCYGIFDVKYLRHIGGMKKLGVGFSLHSGYSPYSDCLLAIKAGLLEKVVYVDAPLVFFRTHAQSISCTSPDIDAYRSAQEALCCKSIEVFRAQGLNEDFHLNLFLLLRWCIRDFATVVRRSGSINRRQIVSYIYFLKKYIGFLKGSRLYWKTIGLLSRTALVLLRDIGRIKFSRRLDLVVS